MKIEFIRMAREPMKSVAKGCLQAALEEMSAWEEPEKQAAPTTLERAAVSGTPKRGLPSLANFRKAA